MSDIRQISLSESMRDRINEYASTHGVTQRAATEALVEAGFEMAAQVEGHITHVGRGISDDELKRAVEHLASLAPAEPASAPANAPAGISSAHAARLAVLATSRSQTPDEAMADCLAWLGAPPPGKTRVLESQAIVPAASPPLHPDGQPFCKCDGSYNYGPHHRCHRHAPTELPEGVFA